MRFFRWSARIALFGSLAAACYLLGGMMVSASRDGPPRLVVPDRVSLGNVQPGATVQATIIAKNAGAGTLNLASFRLRCGCAQIHEQGRPITKDSRLSIPPDGAAHLELNITPIARVGEPWTTSIDFESDDPQKPRCQIVIQCNIQGYWLAQPQLIDALTLVEGQTEERKIDIVGFAADTALPVRRVVSDVPDVVEIVECVPGNVASVLIPGGVSVAQLRLRLRPMPDGRRTDAKVSVFADDSAVPNCVIPVAVQGRPFVVVSPAVAVLPRFVNGEKT